MNNIKKNIYSIENRKIFYFLFSIFFLIIILISGLSYFKVKKDNGNINSKEYNIKPLNNTIQTVNLLKQNSKNSKNKIKGDMWNITIVKINPSNIFRKNKKQDNNSINNKTPQRLILNGKNYKHIPNDKLTIKRQEVVANQWNLLFENLISNINTFNIKNKDKWISIKYNKLKILTTKNQIIKVLANYLVFKKGDDYSIKWYLDKNQIDFISFIQNINGLLSDVLWAPIFYLDLDVKYLNNIHIKQYYNWKWLMYDNILKKKLEKILDSIRKNEKITNPQDKRIKREKDYLINQFLLKYLSELKIQSINLDNKQYKGYNTLITMALLLKLNIDKYSFYLNKKDIINIVFKKLIKDINNMNIVEWNKKEIIYYINKNY